MQRFVVRPVLWFGFDVFAMTISEDSVWDAKFCFVKHTHTHTHVCVCVCVCVCLDVNECAKNNGGCDSKRKCTNSVGSMKCGNCPAGWTNDGAKACKGLWCGRCIDSGSIC